MLKPFERAACTPLWLRAAVLVAVLLAQAARAADLFVDAGAGSDSNPGTAAQPWRTLARVQQSIQPGDRANLSGVFRENLKVRNASGCVFKQWAGMPQAILRGDTVVPALAWSLVVPGVFEYAVPNGTLDNLSEAVASVVIDWDSSVDAQGRHFGHLKRAASLSGVIAGSNSYFFISNGAGGGTVRIGIEASYTTPASLQERTIAYCRGNVNGIELGTPTYNPYPAWGAYTGQNVTGAVIDGIHLYLWADSGQRLHIDTKPGEGENAANPAGTRSIGYGVRIADGVGCTIRNVVTIDTGYHGLGFVGNACRDNRFEACEVWGGAPNLISGNSSYVFYSGPSAAGSNVTGCRGVACRAFKYTFLGRDGAPILPQAGCDAMISHTDNQLVSNSIRDVRWDDCDVFESGDPVTGGGCVGSAFAGGGLSGAPSDPGDPETYPVRYVNCRLWNGAQNYTALTGSCAYVNCSLRLSRAGAWAQASRGCIGALSGPSFTLFAGCEIIADLDRPGADMRLFSCADQNQVLLVNSSVYVNGADVGAPNAQAIFSISSNAVRPIFARASVFGFRAPSGDPANAPHRLVLGNPGMHDVPGSPACNQFYYDFKDCAYFNLSAYASVASADEESEWRTGAGGAGSNGSVIDPGGRYLRVVNAYADASGADLEPTLSFRGVKKPLRDFTPTGVNGVPYDGTYGAWQYGGALAIYLGPEDQGVFEGRAAAFSVVASGPEPLAFRWTRDGVDLFDSPSLHGSASRTLRLDAATVGDAGTYEATITDATGASVSASGALVVTPCPSDIDHNGFVNGDDFDAFVEMFTWGDAGADFDGNGFVNGDDFDGFSSAFEGGC